ncbi:hypothetical protein B0H13DRAFT_1869687 [Mycena leptocephala]|nr:hypothetical protein B0H13DRAFT_1869687 [Mycena leptocephala]
MTAVTSVNTIGPKMGKESMTTVGSIPGIVREGRRLESSLVTLAYVEPIFIAVVGNLMQKQWKEYEDGQCARNETQRGQVIKIAGVAECPEGPMATWEPYDTSTTGDTDSLQQRAHGNNTFDDGHQVPATASILKEGVRTLQLRQKEVHIGKD